MTDPKIVAWLVGAGVSSSVLMWWFHTRLPIHFLEIARLIFFWTRKSDFWTVSQSIGGKTYRTDLEDMSSVDLERWFGEHFGRHVSELLSCPGCFSAHVSWWVAVSVQFATGFDLLFFVSCWLTWPVVSNLALACLKK